MEKLANKFKSKFDKDVQGFVSSPGRIEALGNHTDHNNGKVLAAATNLSTKIAFSENNSKMINIYSEGFGQMQIDMNKIESYREDCKSTEKSSSSMVAGIIKKLTEKDYPVKGFDGYITSNVHVGSGMSSSASFEVGIATVFENIGDFKLKKIEKAKICRWAENEFYGKPCGLMDQISISSGGFSFIDFRDMKKPFLDKMNFSFDNYSIIVCNTGKGHHGLDNLYSSIGREMKEVAKFFGKENLGEVNVKIFFQSLSEGKIEASDRAILRAIHFFNENMRVEYAREALKNHDIKTFLDAVNASGESSYKLLQNAYVPGSEEQNLAKGIAIGKFILGDKGAVRLMGGGFEGTTISFVPKEMVNIYIKTLNSNFGENSCQKIEISNEGAK